MISDFENFSARATEVNSLSVLKGHTVGIEAGSFLQKYFEREGNFYEALLPALGGLPFGLRAFLEQDVAALKEKGITPIFVFDGLDSGKKHAPFQRTNRAVERNVKAWEFYSLSQQPNSKIRPEELLDSFRKSDWSRPEIAYRLFQTILRKLGVEFQVAPYSANAQLAYLSRQNDYLDAVVGSSELVLYDVRQPIMDLNLSKKQFTWVQRRAWIDELGLTPEQFVDVCLLAGTSHLEALPILSPRTSLIGQAIAQVTSGGGKPAAILCKELQGNPEMARLDYFDRFCRVKLAVRHPFVLTVDGKVEEIDKNDVPWDFHKVIGPRLPDEIYYYLSLGAISPRLLEQLTSDEIYVTVPADGGDSDDYKSLVQERLLPIRTTALCLFSLSLARGYQHKPYTFRFWFDERSGTSFKPSEESSNTSALRSWKVPGSVIESIALPRFTKDRKPSLSFAMQSLREKEFAAKTIAGKDAKVLVSQDTVSANTIWRFLHVRGYVSDDHSITPWGNVLCTILEAFGPQCSSELEQASMLATELLRADMLHSKITHPKYSPQVLNGDENDRSNCLLLSRIGSLGYLQNKEIGYSGFLSHSVLGYNSVVNATQEALRDLLEVCLATMLLNGDASRDPQVVDLTAVGLSLPFLLPLNSALGLAVNGYLDNVTTVLGREDFETEKERLKNSSELSWLPSAVDLKTDLAKAWTIFDAVFAGVKRAVELSILPAATAEEWSKTAAWLEKRR